MTSKEVVSRSIAFSGPERMPFDMPVSGPSDVLRVGAAKAKTKYRTADSYTDHFGCRFEILNQKTMGQPTDFPLKDLKKLDEYEFPDPHNTAMYDEMEEGLEKAGDKYVCAYTIWFTFFERMHFLHGFEQTLVDLYEEPKLLMALADRVIDYNIAVIEEIGERFPGRVHAVAASDDWGMQAAPFINPKLFRKFFFPRYKKMFGAVRDLGMDVWLHSCGYVIDLIPMFIESGVQVLNLQQPRIFDLRQLAKFKGSVCFNLPVDLQNTMPRGTREEIEAEANLLVETLSVPQGGFIANEHPDYAGNGIDPIKGKWAYKAFQAADPFRRRNAAVE